MWSLFYGCHVRVSFIRTNNVNICNLIYKLNVCYFAECFSGVFLSGEYTKLVIAE